MGAQKAVLEQKFEKVISEQESAFLRKSEHFENFAPLVKDLPDP